MKFEPVCFLFGLGVCVSCAHSAFKVSFAPFATICYFRFRAASVLNSGGCPHSTKPFCILDGLSADVSRLHRIRLSDWEKKRRGRREASLPLHATLERTENKGSCRRQSYCPTLYSISTFQLSWCIFHPSSTRQQRLLLQQLHPDTFRNALQPTSK